VGDEASFDAEIEELGAPPVWTMGTGGSGGAIQQVLLAHNYPGILDGLVPSLTFQDAQLAEPADCRLLNAYFAANPGLSVAQRQAITGYRNVASCTLWDLAFANVLVAAVGCDPSVPVALRYHPVANPTGARCTTWDSMVNVWGRDPDTGFARRTFDNGGVQYGLGALQAGAIDVDTFLDLNERIGGYDNDGTRVPARSVADRSAVSIGYTSGRVALDGALSDVPILDVRSYTDAAGDFHTYSHSFVLRERLRQVFGHADNHVLRRAGGAGTAAMAAGVLDTTATGSRRSSPTTPVATAPRWWWAPSRRPPSTPAGPRPASGSRSRPSTACSGSARASTRRGRRLGWWPGRHSTRPRSSARCGRSIPTSTASS
jgi:hypothetical protein